MIASARYVYGPDRQRASIIAVINGVERCIPLAAGNGDYEILMASGVAIDDPGPPPVPVPTITRRQCRLWLLQQHGKTSADVEAAIAAIADAATREAARIEWEDATAFHHDHPLMTALAPALGIDPATLPDAFRAAALL